MGEYLEQIPTTVREHLQGITRAAGLPKTDESVELMAEAWLGKKEAFEREIEDQQMEEVDSLDRDDERGAIVMTYSGSLINIGPVVGDARNVEYASIGIRTDVPNAAEHDAAVLGGDLEKDQEVRFDEGPVASTSAIFKIAVCQDDLSAEDQEEALSNITMALTREFADINKTLVIQ